MGGQIIGAKIVSAPKQHNSGEKKRAIKAGEVPQEWQDKPAKIVKKNHDAGWTVKYPKPRRPVETPSSIAAKQHDISFPIFGFKNHA